MTTVQSIRVFDARQGTRDGLDFSIEINKTARRGFISGTALGILRGDFQGELEELFEARAPSIAIAASRKAESTPEGEEISIGGDDVAPPK